ncbi:MAG TPA: hypothetical protein VIT65_00155 [Microlunatus sp.]
MEYLVAAVCILTTRGELNVSTSLVDDEGVDLVFNRRNSPATLAVQVKARMSDSKRLSSGGFVAIVREQTFTPRATSTCCSSLSTSQRGRSRIVGSCRVKSSRPLLGSPTPRPIPLQCFTEAGRRRTMVSISAEPCRVAPKTMDRLTG